MIIVTSHNICNASHNLTRDLIYSSQNNYIMNHNYHNVSHNDAIRIILQYEVMFKM